MNSSILRRACQREPDAWQRIADLFGPMIYGWSRRYGLTAEDSADVAQETLATVVRCLDQFQPSHSGGFRSWLWTISRNKMHDVLRRRQGKPQAIGGMEPLLIMSQIPAEPEPSETIYSSGWGHTVRRALELIRDEFEARTWQAFWLVAVEDQEPAEVARSLGTSPAAVRQAKSRILRRLRLELGELPDQP